MSRLEDTPLLHGQAFLDWALKIRDAPTGFEITDVMGSANGDSSGVYLRVYPPHVLGRLAFQEVSFYELREATDGTGNKTDDKGAAHNVSLINFGISEDPALTNQSGDQYIADVTVLPHSLKVPYPHITFERAAMRNSGSTVPRSIEAGDGSVESFTLPLVEVARGSEFDPSPEGMYGAMKTAYDVYWRYPGPHAWPAPHYTTLRSTLR